MEELKKKYRKVVQVNLYPKLSDDLREVFEMFLFGEDYEAAKKMIEDMSGTPLTEEVIKRKLNLNIIKPLLIQNFESFIRNLEGFLRDLFKSIKMMNFGLVVTPKEFVRSLGAAFPTISNNELDTLEKVLNVTNNNRSRVLKDSLEGFRFENSQLISKTLIENLTLEDEVMRNHLKSLGVEISPLHLQLIVFNNAMEMIRSSPLAMLEFQQIVANFVMIEREILTISMSLFELYEFHLVFEEGEVDELKTQVERLAKKSFLEVFTTANLDYIKLVEEVANRMVADSKRETEHLVEELLHQDKKIEFGNTKFLMYKKSFQTILYYFNSNVEDSFLGALRDPNLIRFKPILIKISKAYDDIMRELLVKLRDFFENSEELLRLRRLIRGLKLEPSGDEPTFPNLTRLEPNLRKRLLLALVQTRFSQFSVTQNLDWLLLRREDHAIFLQRTAQLLWDHPERQLINGLAVQLGKINFLDFSSALNVAKTLPADRLNLNFSEEEFLPLIAELFVLQFAVSRAPGFRGLYNETHSLPDCYPSLRRAFFQFVRLLSLGESGFLNFQMIIELENFAWTESLARAPGARWLDPVEPIDVKNAQNSLGSKVKLEFSQLSEESSLIPLLSVSGFLSEDTDKKKEWSDLQWHQRGVSIFALNWGAHSNGSIRTFMQSKLLEIPQNLLFYTGLPGLAMSSVRVVADSYGQNPFTAANQNALDTAATLSNLIKYERLFAHRALNLVSFSLGTVLVLETLLRLADGTTPSCLIVHDVILAGSCINLEHFETVLHKLIGTNGIIKGKLFVFHSFNDIVLKYLFKAAKPSESALGFWGLSAYQAALNLWEHDPVLSTRSLKEVQAYVAKKYECVDVSDFVDGHSLYRINFPKILEAINFNVDYSGFFELSKPSFF